MSDSDITNMLIRWAELSSDQRNVVIAQMYEELRRVAGRALGGERGPYVMQPTSLVHEAYTRLIDLERIDWSGRRHFLAVAAKIMRQLIVDHARHVRAQKRNLALQTELRDDLPGMGSTPTQVLAIEDALTVLAEIDGQQAAIVEMRLYGGMSVDDVADHLDISPRTVKRKWQSARLWLYDRLSIE